jgi:hypothetical protein
MRGWSTGAIVWLTLAILFGLSGASCTVVPGGWGTLSWLQLTLAMLCLSGLAYCRVAARRGWRVGVFVLGACFGLLVAWVRLHPFDWWFDTMGFGNRDFDSALWKQARGGDYTIDDPSPRAAMVRSLLRTRRLEGLVEKQVIDLLGEADSNEGYDIWNDRRVWEYYIGPCSGFQMDTDGLVMSFDASGGVADVWLVQH